MRNLHLILLQKFGIKARCLFREWERLRLRSSDHKNHRIFSLRCLHKDLIPVSIKLKSTLDTSKARQIIRKAEKDFLQARIKAINNILVQVNRQIEECRAKLASIILAERLGECQDFINKVSKFRFNKVRQRQINKLNHLVSKKEGNITIANAANNITNSVNRQAQAPCNPTPAIALLPPREGSNSPPATGHLLPEGTGLPQANNQVIGSHPTPARAHLPPGEGSNSPPATVHPPSGGNSSPPIVRHQASCPLWQLLTFLPGKEAILPRQLFTLPQKVTALPITRHQAVFLLWQLLTFLPGKEAILSWELYTFPQKMSALPRPLFSFPQGKKTIPPRLLLSLYTGRETAPLNPLGHPRQGKVITPLGQAGRVIGTPPGTSLHSLPRRPEQPPGKATLHPHPPVGPTKVLQMKNLTLSGSLTFPTNSWHQLKCLFWLKDPTLWLPLGSLLTEYITVIEAACTKLSQQDAEELGADINRVLRSSHPPNPT